MLSLWNAKGRCFDVNIKPEYLKIVDEFLSSKDEQKTDNIYKYMEFILHNIEVKNQKQKLR